MTLTNLPKKQLNRMALFTDYHVGKQRTEFYTQITEEYMDWFVGEVRADPSIDSIGFLGDWHDFQNSIYIDTLNLSYKLLTKLNSLNLPIIFVVGNHDLFNRRHRDVHSCVFFTQFSNMVVLNQPHVLPNFDGGALFSPYLFHAEYNATLTNSKSHHLLGHLEFKDFILTGQTVKMEHGPDCTEFSDYRTILSGHFHKRQRQRNVQYIGNTFCTNFADAGDIDRGLCIYQFDTATCTFKNWSGSPRYIKTTLSKLTGANPPELTERSFVSCLADIPITYEDSVELKREISANFGVRGMDIMEDVEALKDSVSETESGIDSTDVVSSSTDDLVRQMLQQLKLAKVDNTTLVNLYNTL